MNVIEFAKKYRKLNCLPGELFTTIRRDSHENDSKFVFKEGQLFVVKVKGENMMNARLLCSTSVGRVRYLSQYLRDYDTDGNAVELFDRYGDDFVILLIFQKVGDVERGNTL